MKDLYTILARFTDVGSHVKPTKYLVTDNGGDCQYLLETAAHAGVTVRPLEDTETTFVVSDVEDWMNYAKQEFDAYVDAEELTPEEAKELWSLFLEEKYLDVNALTFEVEAEIDTTEYLDSLTPELKEKITAADDALDDIMIKLLKDNYNLDVVANINGNRNLISVNGKVMNQNEFGRYFVKLMKGEN